MLTAFRKGIESVIHTRYSSFVKIQRLIIILISRCFVRLYYFLNSSLSSSRCCCSISTAFNTCCLTLHKCNRSISAIFLTKSNTTTNFLTISSIKDKIKSAPIITVSFISIRITGIINNRLNAIISGSLSGITLTI